MASLPYSPLYLLCASKEMTYKDDKFTNVLGRHI
jgi:hypothetical protein